jgi:hypothetical protein
MDRRQAILRSAGLLGASLLAPPLLLNRCAGETNGASAGPLEVAFWEEVADTILPATDDAGGAKAAGVGAFMQVIVDDCYGAEEKQEFLAGMQAIEDEALKRYEAGFMELDPQQRFTLVDAIDRAARADQGHPFTRIKDLTLWGYFSSEVGCREALRYNPIPGRFEGCIPYANEPAWAG